MLPFPEYFWIILIVAAFFLLVGFYKFIWFMSVGYGLAIAGIGGTMTVLYFVDTIKGNETITIGGILYVIVCLALLVYGLRLSLFLLIRELKNANYKKTLDKAMGGSAEKKMPVPVLISMWLLNTALFYAQTSPLLYRLTAEDGKANANALDGWLIAGAIICIAGVIIEAIADAQKSAQKKVDPHMAATKGLYKMCRCPNYFGEILVWTGVFVSGCSSMTGWQWVIAAIGYVSIVYIMINGAKRLEKRQNKNYGENKVYQEYVAKTPILFPLIPLYHLVKAENKDAK